MTFGQRAFRDRVDAGRQLGELLAQRQWERPLVLGIPRGGVVVAAEVAKRLGGELGVVVARKLRTPGQPELAMGAVTSDGTVYLEEDVIRGMAVSPAELEAERRLQMAEAAARERRYGSGWRERARGRDVIVVDDGVATGSTAKAAVRALRKAGARRVVVAVPVGPPSTLKELAEEADEAVALFTDPLFMAVGAYYEDFRPTTDEEVERLLKAQGPQGAG